MEPDKVLEILFLGIVFTSFVGIGYYFGSQKETININSGNYTFDTGENLVKIMELQKIQTNCNDVKNYECVYYVNDDECRMEEKIWIMPR